ncbi:MAG: biotin--[acetyl-CoA-carboxylase] ligase [Bacteroidales bacterium]|jgi:BirA family biotin operon repressor/biotin-[acetyl-CoA-carboxylase] ligase|nr:biotin--[acetyl-CoA-carboxylase] ligase [Bacteroidales bacterium]
MMKFKTVFFPVLQSTNQYMSGLLNAGEEIDGLAIRAGFQEAGKGQAENSWHSQADKNLLISLGFNFSFLKAAQQFSITQMASLAVLEVLKTFSPQAELSVKWPNDIFVGDKKIGGMLISNTVNGLQLERTIIGLGINLNQIVFPEALARVVSLKQLTGKLININDFEQNLLDSFLKQAAFLKSEIGRKTLEKNYLNQLYAFDKFRPYSVNGQKKQLKITGIGAFGYLLMADEQGQAFSFDMKEIVFLF